MIKFIDLRPTKEEAKLLNDAYDRVFNSGVYIGGKEVEAFEKEWAEYCEAKYCVGVGNGFDALVLACGYMAEEHKPIKPGMNVSWKTCIPSWKACLTSCSPIPEKDHKEKMKMAVHIYGQIALPAEYDKDYLVEDCAQAHGASKDGIKAGKFGKIACWSFYPTKNLGALGDAGAITTDDEAVAEYARKLRNYGGRDGQGINSRLDPLQAAFLRAKLPLLDDYVLYRQTSAGIYSTLINKTGLIDIPELDPYGGYHIFAIETDYRDELRKYLFDNGVETMIHYSEVPYPSYWKVPEAERWIKRTLSLPIEPHVTTEQCEHIADLINQWQESK